MKNHIRYAALIVLAAALTTAPAIAEDWTRFRGPNGSGIANGSGYPSEFGPEENVVWKAAVRPGQSSPVLNERHIFITAFHDGKLYTQCFDRRTGELVWERAVEREREAELNQLNEPASISPVTDGENVYVFFRDVGVLAYDSAGRLLWKTPLAPFANYMGQSASPILADDRLIILADQDEGSYIAALRPSNGEIEWKTARDEGQAWATPLMYDGSAGARQILTIGRGVIGSHQLDNGKRLWGQRAIPPAIVASPVVAGNTVYAFGYGNAANRDFAKGFEARDKDSDGVLNREEYESSAFMAGIAKYRGNRDGVLEKQEYVSTAQETVAPSSLVAFRFEDAVEPRELWRYERAFNGVIPSALVYNNVIYLIKNGGILETLDAETGEMLKRGRVRDAIEGYSASPVAADGKVYLASEGGKVAVLKAGREWEILAVNDVGGEIFATPALSEGKVFVRTSEQLYCFGK
jgi:outer membrane protein assembly factor BamB